MTDPTPAVRAIVPRQSCGPDKSSQGGLTLIELMVGVAMLVITLSVAAPHFNQWGRATRVSAQAGDLQSAMAYARTESLRRGVRVAVCRTANPTLASPSCDPSVTWASGWLVFVDNVHQPGNVPGNIDAADTILRIGEAMRNSAVTTTGNLGPWLAYSPQGLVRTAAGPATGSFGICQSPHGKRISVSPVGLISLVNEAC